jgi:hypothetical protein
VREFIEGHAMRGEPVEDLRRFADRMRDVHAARAAHQGPLPVRQLAAAWAKYKSDAVALEQAVAKAKVPLQPGGTALGPALASALDVIAGPAAPAPAAPDAVWAPLWAGLRKEARPLAWIHEMGLRCGRTEGEAERLVLSAVRLGSVRASGKSSRRKFLALAPDEERVPVVARPERALVARGDEKRKRAPSRASVSYEDDDELETLAATDETDGADEADGIAPGEIPGEAIDDPIWPASLLGGVPRPPAKIEDADPWGLLWRGLREDYRDMAWIRALGARIAGSAAEAERVVLAAVEVGVISASGRPERRFFRYLTAAEQAEIARELDASRRREAGPVEDDEEEAEIDSDEIPVVFELRQPSVLEETLPPADEDPFVDDAIDVDEPVRQSNQERAAASPAGGPKRRMTGKRTGISEAIRGALTGRGDMTAATLAQATGFAQNNIAVALARLSAQGHVVKVTKGIYRSREGA